MMLMVIKKSAGGRVNIVLMITMRLLMTSKTITVIIMITIEILMVIKECEREGGAPGRKSILRARAQFELPLTLIINITIFISIIIVSSIIQHHHCHDCSSMTIVIVAQ